MRVLITVTPLMYREALAVAVYRHRPDLEVRIAPPEAAGEEVRSFGPHLLVRNDTDGLDLGIVAGIPCWVEVLYSDNMDARISVDGHVSDVRDICIEDLIAVVDRARELTSGAS